MNLNDLLEETTTISLPTQAEIDNKDKIIAEITKLKRIYSTSKNEDVLPDLNDYEQQLKRITDYELKMYPYHERVSIMTEQNNMLTTEMEEELKKEKFQTEFNAFEIKCIRLSSIEHPKNMKFTEDGILTGLEAIYGIENCRNPYGNLYAY